VAVSTTPGRSLWVVVYVHTRGFLPGSELFETYDGLSFGDATIAAYMQREGIEYLYSFDDDFDTLDGIMRLETTDNPFN